MDVAVDTGGTFTDLVAWTDQGSTLALKVPSTPHDPSLAVRHALEKLAQRMPGRVRSLVHGTTVATNALLERRGARVVFVTNAGFEDLLYLGRQNRPSIYQLHPTQEPPLVDAAHSVGVRGRLNYLGRETIPLEPLDSFIGSHYAMFEKAEAVAICLLHAYVNPQHERALKSALERHFPHASITLSSSLSPLSREYERAQTVVANAFVSPVISQYLAQLERIVQPAALTVMDSSGGRLSVEAATSAPIRTALSGPAGGVRGAWATGVRENAFSILGLDIGGTSTDVSLACNNLSPGHQGRVGSIPLRTAMLQIETIGAGGGSIASIDEGGALQVGPESAGAVPGPAAYGHAGAQAQPTVTDAHVVLGRIPSLLGGAMTIDHQAANNAIAPLAATLGRTVQQTALAMIATVEATMVRACKTLCMSEGVDSRELSLVAFGGAGGLHGCQVAQALGCQEVLFPENSGVLSAVGMMHAPVQVSHTQSYFASSADFHETSLLERVSACITEMAERACFQQPPRLRVNLGCQFVGQSHPVEIDLSHAWPAPTQDGQGAAPKRHAGDLLEDIRVRFHARHEKLYGWTQPRSECFEIVSYSVTLFEEETASLQAPPSTAEPSRTGPCAISTYSATLWVPAGWVATRGKSGTWRCRQTGERVSTSQSVDVPLNLDIHRQRLHSIAEEMGAALMRSSYSANIKERRDFSCAIFDNRGRLLMQAAHIPVHLGSQELSVQAVLASLSLAPQQSAILNDPFCGGTHLPDVTLVSPVYLPGKLEPTFYIANRAHHADVGGISPGSMPAPFDEEGNTRELTIHDEGFRLRPTLLDSSVREDFANASRTPKERMGDLRAQEAANHVGVLRLLELAASVPKQQDLQDLNEHLLDYSEARMRAVLEKIPDGVYRFEDALDNDGLSDQAIWIRVELTISGSSSRVDFSASDPGSKTALNAVRAITLAATYYVFRCLAGSDIPASGGIMRPIEVVTQLGSICDATEPMAVSSGNVETSQRLVDVLLGALEQALPGQMPAASCGTMNNVLLGGNFPDGPETKWVHYETLAGGCGASAQGPGASAMHSHMTNTLNTPVEELERLFPITMTTYALRKESAASTDQYPGGRGILRGYRFHAPTSITLMTERRTRRPYGLRGGQDGVVGSNKVLCENGNVVPLAGKASYAASAGDELQIETPGGGGWGCKKQSPPKR